LEAVGVMLQLENIVCRYGNVQALSGVTLNVREGELVSLIGANGAGKSTLLRAISGLVPPVVGTIRFRGERIEQFSPSAIVRRGVAHCPEERQLWPFLSVEDNLALGAYVRKDREKIRQDLEWINEIFPVLGERRRQLCGTLSGGEQQMVSIGRALLLRPNLLMMDEPSLGLAPIVIDHIAEVIRKIHLQGTTMLLVEQNAFLALELSDRAYVLETGRIVREGGGQELLHDPYVKDAYLGGRSLKGRLKTRHRKG
jgi:branched-chain amino acid transport system ATP-binding protein